MYGVGPDRAAASGSRVARLPVAETPLRAQPSEPGAKISDMGEVADYIAGLDEPARALLERLRVRALELVPAAEEGKSYGMAALRYRGRPLLSVVVARHGYSLFPFSSEIVETAIATLPGFDSTKGGIRFTDAKPIPDQVFDRIVLDRRDQIDTALPKP